MPDIEAREAFPKILDAYMAQHNMKQSDVARSVHVSKQIVSDWLSGKKFPRVDKMQELAELFGVLLSDMYTPDILSKRLNSFSVSSPMYNSPKTDFDYLSADEHTLINAYRAADDRAREDAMKTLLNHPREKDGQSAI